MSADFDTDRALDGPTPAGRRRRWPLLAIGASAGTATWSGWVGLGQLTGFGVVHPLPGIWDDLTINTAVTLPIGVEAYAMYALSIATTSQPLPARTRRYAWASSAAALILGMAGQVAYHVMTADHPATGKVVSAQPGVASGLPGGLAPWWVIALVSCLPVLVLGAASLLWHLAATTGDPIRSDHGSGIDPDLVSDRAPVLDPIHGHTPDLGDSASSDQVGTVASSDPSRSPAPVAAGDTRSTRRFVPVSPRARDVSRVRDAVASGDLPARPSATAIRALLAISPAYARAARDAVNTTTSTPSRPPQSHPAPRPQTTSNIQPEAVPAQPEETPEHLLEEAISAVTKNPEPDTQPITKQNLFRKDEELHTYATPLT